MDLNNKILESKSGGTSVPTVIIHGWGQSFGSLEQLGKLLSGVSDIHLIDLPGFGKSELPPTDWSTEDYASCVLEYMEKNSLEKVNLIGHSLGGRISIRLASNHPSKVNKLVLISSHGLQSIKTPLEVLRNYLIRKMSLLYRFFDGVYGTSFFEKFFVPKYGSRDYKAAGKLRGTLVKIVNEDLSQIASKITSKTLLIYGTRDTETPLSYGRRYKSIINESKLIVLKGQDHFPFLDVGSHLLAYYIRPFLKEKEEESINA